MQAVRANDHHQFTIVLANNVIREFTRNRKFLPQLTQKYLQAPPKKFIPYPTSCTTSNHPRRSD